MPENKKNAFALTDRTADFDAADISGNHLMGIFAYLSWLVLIPIFAAKVIAIQIKNIKIRARFFKFLPKSYFFTNAPIK